MTKISIQNLNADGSYHPSSKLTAHEYALVESALKRAVDARKIKGGTASIRLSDPTIGLIYRPDAFY